MNNKIFNFILLVLLIFTIGTYKFAINNAKVKPIVDLTVSKITNSKSTLYDAHNTSKELENLINNISSIGINVYVLDNENINAFTNGRNIYLFKGLIKKMNVDGLYMVILHEYGHIMNGHIQKHNARINEYVQPCIKEGYSKSICEFKAMHDLLILAFDRQQESEADEFAFHTALLIGKDDKVCDDMFNPLGRLDGPTDIYSTHPANSERYETCKEYFKINQ
jgi:Zn-dependent protease with chaperone function